MLVILTDEQILSPKQVCQGCLMANRSGLPRWNRGKLGCGQVLDRSRQNRPMLYECQMGFRVAEIEGAIALS
ncbi:hypothetical protein IQ249_00325 [Lusitaniella coriacea LEGE 07157]|uniref:Uncharacterized protein n=1 Tax=Lusitaniella coriacea LEGE 07157 TaxID=945747 RepID=A0A8J7B2G0_9CYAN|nr:hypothetical protein [Lusitaniella coriacea]MBE9114332.1 hypothetical protein [Lusitaniella coriacea LEGE 07157]